jgi:hypothetical protein
MQLDALGEALSAGRRPGTHAGDDVDVDVAQDDDFFTAVLSCAHGGGILSSCY